MALVDLGPVGAERVLVDAAGRLPSTDERWPSPGDLATLVGDPAAWAVGVPWRTDDGTVVNLLRASPAAAGPWRPVAEVDPLLALAVAELRDGPPADGRPDWWRLGWADEVRAWVDEVLAATGAVRVGPGEPFKTWSLSAVVRFVVRRAGGEVGEVWFKATCEAFRAEPAITAWVADVAPQIAPVLLAHDTDRAWLLLAPFEGADDDPSVEELAQLARACARAQVATLDRVDGLLRAGAPERGLAATLEALDALVHDGVELPSMTEQQRRDVVAAWPRWVERLTELHGLGLPLALVHGDLHVWNVGRSATGPVVFDWTDACLAHPYLDARHLARSAAHAAGPDAADAVRDGFVEVWSAAYPHVDHQRAWELSLVGDRVFTLLSYEAIYRAQRPQDRWELAGVGVEILEELLGLQ